MVGRLYCGGTSFALGLSCCSLATFEKACQSIVARIVVTCICDGAGWAKISSFSPRQCINNRIRAAVTLILTCRLHVRLTITRVKRLYIQFYRQLSAAFDRARSQDNTK